MKTGSTIRALRKKNNYSTSDFAKFLGFKNKHSVYLIEKDYRQLSGPRFDRMCALFKLTPVQFYKLVEKQKTPE